MGKYTRRKGKIRGDISMEIPHSSSYGVRTRSRTLALQPHSDLSYLQLRTRRLQKPPPPKPKTISVGPTRAASVVGVEDSCGDNRFDFDSLQRNTRESTPCSLIRGTETIAAPGSTTRCSASRRGRSAHRAFSTTPEMEEFFAGVELHQQQQFIDKYNYDIRNDLPLPGRYEWVRVDN